MSAYSLDIDTFQKPTPIIKWAGGKRQLMPQLLCRLPKSYGRYFEPFFGGGALFFETMQKNAYISDINEELINLYKVVRDDVESLMNFLKEHENTLEYFTQIRSLDRLDSYNMLSSVERASRFIYLNKTCFNGLYRVNKKGHFNVPFGRYSNPKYLDSGKLYAVSLALESIQIEHANFDNILNFVEAGDFVYFDPPYIPLSESSSFTSYTKEDFGLNEQIKLRDLCNQLNCLGVNFMLSNSDSFLANELYANYKIEKVYATRSINSKASGRGKIAEIIVRNY